MRGPFPPLPYTQIPNVYLDEIARGLTLAENLCLLHIMRQTFGFHRSVDTISLRQFCQVTGLGKSAVATALQRLAKKGLIIKSRQAQRNGGDAASGYQLCFDDGGNGEAPVSTEKDTSVSEVSTPKDTPLSTTEDTPLPAPVSSVVDTHESKKHESKKQQQTNARERAAAAAPADRDEGETCTVPESNPEISPPNPESSAAAIAELLQATGWFPRGIAESLAATAAANRNTRTPEVVAARIRHAETEKKPAQRPGHVRSAILQDWEPPAGFIAEQRRQAMEAIERDRQRERIRERRQEPTPEQLAARELDRQTAVAEWRTAFPEYAARRERSKPPTEAELAVRDEIRRRESERRQAMGAPP